LPEQEIHARQTGKQTMENNRASTVLIFIGGLLLSILALMSVVMTQNNSIGQLARFLLVGGFVICVFRPKTGFFIWLLACGYTDFLKRLMVIAGRISWSDLPYVLGITPVMFAGIVIGCVIAKIGGSVQKEKANWPMLFLGLGLMFFNAALTYFSKGQSVSATLQALANEGIYILLIFVVPVLFRNSHEIIGVWRFLVWVFLPVAIYGIAQKIFGFQDFEIDYLKTGMSIEIKQLFSDRVRAFSTLNSSTALASVCGTLASISLVFTLIPKSGENRRRFNPFVGMILASIYTGGLIASTGRSDMALVLLVPLGVWCFQKPGRTKAIYTMVALGFAILLASSAFLLQNIGTITDYLLGTKDVNSFQQEMLNVNTYSDRLFGFANVLLNPKAWTWLGFGVGESVGNADRFHCHDPISLVLVRFGALGLITYLLTIYYALRWCHRQVFHIRNASHRWLAAVMEAVALGIALVSVLSGSRVVIFPINVLFWLSWGSLLLIVQINKKTHASTPEKEEEREPVLRFQRTKPFWQTTAHES
jgi:hypothetical protein